MTTTNRETWLNDLAALMAPKFEELGHPLPKFHVAIGFPSSGKSGNATAECWNSPASADKAFQIFIRPDTDDSIVIGGSLAHELSHAAAGFKCGHKGDFAKIMLGLGFVRPVTSTNRTEASDAWMQSLIDQLGPIPHARLMWQGSRGYVAGAVLAGGDGEDGGDGADDGGEPSSSNAKPKQTTRQLKAVCKAEGCGYTVRLSRKWADKLGAVCPEHGMMDIEIPAGAVEDPADD